MNNSQTGALGIFLMVVAIIILGINAIFGDLSKNGFFGFMMLIFLVGLVLFWSSGGFSSNKK
ncbi:hypothetical protein [Maribacter litoralis]|uniref:hypothetical protein n=1 Tax=Maribacter litoralis TaxID=2059726 RepID=UPI0013DFA886|nr:hypothetical protein [Maribacter litoralis]|tara:strand:- start:1993 stop:2178 length:186 start_codon:yes stop_codon:yes gene_type:complete